jgi:hypothetical protein
VGAQGRAFSANVYPKSQTGHAHLLVAWWHVTTAPSC